MKKLVRTLSRKMEKNILDTELRESQSTLDQLTHQMRELQKVAHFLRESQDSKDLETASSSGSAHAPCSAAAGATSLTHGI